MIRKSDRAYKIVKARSTKVPASKTFNGLTYYLKTYYPTLPPAKKRAAAYVKAHELVRIVDVGKLIPAGRSKHRYFLYTRMIPYSVYSKW